MPILQHTAKSLRRKQNREADQRRGSARERGYTTKWDRFAKSWLARFPLCYYCKQQGRTSPAEVCDHIVPHGGDMTKFWPHPDLDDWAQHFASCCNRCHNGQKQRAERMAAKTGKDVRWIMRRWGMLPEGFPGSTNSGL